MRISDWSSDVCSSDLGTNEEIATFCSTTYDVSFPIFSKISVAGEDKHPFYAELIRSAPSAQPDGGAAMREKLSGFGLAPNPAPEITWNFEKFLVGRNGEVAVRFAPNEIGRANVRTPVTNAHIVCRLLLTKKNKTLKLI